MELSWPASGLCLYASYALLLCTFLHLLDRLQQHVSSRLARHAAASGGGSSVGIASVAMDAPIPSLPFLIRAHLGFDQDATSNQQQQQQVVQPGSVEDGAISASSVSSRSSRGSSNAQRLRGLVVEAPPGVQHRALYRALWSSNDVQKVVQDRFISISQGEGIL